jgi:soluble lytic murein transglycosylase
MRSISTNVFRHNHILLLLLVVLLAGCSLPTQQPLGEAPTTADSTEAQPQAAQPQAAQPQAAPSPTALPAPDLLARAVYLRSIGEYDAAANDLYTLTQAHPQSAEVRLARFFLAESFALRERWSSAAEALRAVVAEGQQDEWHARALFWLGRCYEEAGDHANAVATFEQYRALKTVLEPYALMREAAQLQALGQAVRAAEVYEAVAERDIARGERAGAYERAIAIRRELGQNDIALGSYTKLIELAQSPAYRARILFEAAALANQLGAVDQARVWLREVTKRSPETTEALGAAQQLAADPQGGLDPAIAARIFDVHELYAEAIPYYDAAIAAATGEPALELRRQRALAIRHSGDAATALAELAAVSAEAPDAEPGRQAQLDWIQTRGQTGETEAAIEGYRQFAQAYPEDPRAPEALSRVVILLGRLGDVEGAAQQQLDLGRRYPAGEQAHTALEQAAWHFHNTGRHAEALSAWDMLSKGASGALAARGAFWGARSAQQLGQNDVAQQLYEAAITAAPDSYYGARAMEQLGRAPTGSIPLGAPVTDVEWREAEEWIASWSGQPAYYVAEQGYPPDVAESGAVPRAIALGQLNLLPDAIIEWNDARSRWSKDPIKLYMTARLAHEHETPYIGLKAAEDLLALAPDKGASAPTALRRLIFPTPYSAVVAAHANEQQVDPRALYALLRQESLFNPGATSWVGARGLAQVMPATGQGIAQNLGVADFHETDLYRPAVSIRFGAFYLGYQQRAMNGSLQAALSAYNGGPGNAQRWAGGTSVPDPDMFTEVIDYEETRSYVRLVYGYYGAYQRLYALP